MKKIFLFAGLLYFIPFTGNGQFKEKNSNRSNSGNSSSSNSNNNRSNITNKNKPKSIDTTKTKFDGDYDAPEAFTASYEDGSSIDYTLSHRNPDDVARLSLFFPANFSFSLGSGNLVVSEIDELGASYYYPNLFCVEGLYGFSSDWDISALVFFKKWAKVTKQRISLKTHQQGNVITDYRSPTVDMPVKAYLGVHIGYGNRNFGSTTVQEQVSIPNYINGPNIYTYSQTYTSYAHEIVLGLGYMGVAHYTLFTSVKNKTITYSRQAAFYVDALLYPSATVGNLTTTNSDAFYAVPASYITTPTLKPKTEGRIYWEYKSAATKGSYEYGLIGRTGFAISPFGNFYFIESIGLYFKII